MMKVDSALFDGAEGLFGHTSRSHLVAEVVETHVASAAVRVSHHHYFLHAKFIYSHYKASHSRVESRYHQSSGIFYNLGIAVLQSERCGEQFGKAGVHARQHSQFFVGILVGEILFVVFAFYETLVVVENLVNHSRNFQYSCYRCCDAASANSHKRGKTYPQCREASIASAKLPIFHNLAAMYYPFFRASVPVRHVVVLSRLIRNIQLIAGGFAIP